VSALDFRPLALLAVWAGHFLLTLQLWWVVGRDRLTAALSGSELALAPRLRRAACRPRFALWAGLDDRGGGLRRPAVGEQISAPNPGGSGLLRSGVSREHCTAACQPGSGRPFEEAPKGVDETVKVV